MPRRTSCRYCQHHAPGWCKRFAAIIHQSEPVTKCERRQWPTGAGTDLAGRQATRAAMAGSELPAYDGDTYRGR